MGDPRQRFFKVRLIYVSFLLSEKSKDPEYVMIHTMVTNRKKPEIQGLRLMDFWTQGAKLKINNQADQTTTPLTEDEIRNQISYAESSKKKWHNSEHFSYWCRYTKTHNISLVSLVVCLDRLNTGYLLQIL